MGQLRTYCSARYIQITCFTSKELIKSMNASGNHTILGGIWLFLEEIVGIKFSLNSNWVGNVRMALLNLIKGSGLLRGPVSV